MPLDASELYTGFAPIRASHVKQFFDLLTGITTDQLVTLKNGLSLTGSLALVDSGIDFTQIATPSSPAASHNKLYFKSDGLLYRITSAGAESAVPGPLGVSEAMLANNAVATTKIAAGAVTSPKITLIADDPPVGANPSLKSQCVGWAWITVSGGTPSLVNSYNVDSITDLGTGYIQVVWDRNVDLNGGQPTGAPIGQTYSDGGLITEITASANTDAQFRARDYSLGNLTDPLGWSVAIFGTLV